MIYLPEKIWKDLYFMALHKGIEVGGLLKSELIEYGGEKGILVTDHYIPKQVGSGSEIVFNEEDLVKFTLNLDDDELSQWNGWWHSHHSMSTSPSGTDVETTRDKLGSIDLGYRFGIIINHKNEMTGMLATNYPTRHYCEVDVEILYDDVTLTLLNELDEKFKEKVYKSKSVKTKYAYWNKAYDDDDLDLDIEYF
jgi:proteasome lid subunit RPN8/RPN11